MWDYHGWFKNPVVQKSALKVGHEQIIILRRVIIFLTPPTPILDPCATFGPPNASWNVQVGRLFICILVALGMDYCVLVHLLLPALLESWVIRSLMPSPKCKSTCDHFEFFSHRSLKTWPQVPFISICNSNLLQKKSNFIYKSNEYFLVIWNKEMNICPKISCTLIVLDYWSMIIMSWLWKKYLKCNFKYLWFGLDFLYLG